MPPKRKRRGRHKPLQEEQDGTESESGKLSETQEVARRLSRARLGKENSNPRVVNRPVNTSLPSQRESDSYDADSEPDGNQPLFQDQCLPSHLSERVPSFHSDHSTPTVQVVGTWPTLPFSPVGIPQPPLGPDTPHNSGHMAPSVPSPRKRKPDVGFYDVPFTKPKRSKRKTKAVPDHQETAEDPLETMRLHFMEIENVELIIE